MYCLSECSKLKQILVGPLFLIGFSNSLFNPIIYCWWHTKFRTNATRIFRKRFGESKWCKCCFPNVVDSENITLSSPRVTATSELANEEVNNNDVVEINTEIR